MPVAVFAILFTASTLTVQADVPLARPSSTLPPTAPPEALAPQVKIHPAPGESPYILRGIASWYGAVLNGHRTASGERFNMFAMTACHPTLPFGSVVRVVDLDNQRSVVVRINDRGILFPGRIIDLSYAAAKRLNIVRSGLAPVSLQVLALGRPHHRRSDPVPVQGSERVAQADLH
ncbi:MAG TPA: septal ring lytic transglycosylase RlpA family protein [Terracidiphilus sp.]|nr:septal ring lytic transglycosylase RlpA family protein [Terracidiphilus sp.]